MTTVQAAADKNSRSASELARIGRGEQIAEPAHGLNHVNAKLLADAADEPAYVPALEGAGYILRIREADLFEHRMFKGPDTDINLHVFSENCPEIEQMLLFRDRLRANAADRELYARTKRELAAQDWAFTQNYADAKSAVVAEIMARAQVKR